MRQFAVIGLGRFGSAVAITLAKMGYEVLGIDVNQERVNEMAETITESVKADAIDEQSLKALGIRNFDVVIVAIGRDIQASILTTVILKDMGVGKVIAKAQTELHGKVLERIGADKVVFPERDMGEKLAKVLVSENIIDEITLSPEYDVVEMAAPNIFYGKTLEKLNVRNKYGISILAIRRGSDIIVSPDAKQIISDRDILVVIGKNEKIRRFEILDV
jgi:trk system potassium uptake protein TrkA